MKNKQPVTSRLRSLFVFGAFLLSFGCTQFEVIPIDQIEGNGVMPSDGEQGGAALDEGGNAAQEFCLEQGGQIVSRQDTSGQYTACALNDGSECEVWALYDGDCSDSHTSGAADDATHDETDLGFEIDMGDEGSEVDAGEAIIAIPADDIADWDIAQDMFFAGEVTGVAINGNGSLTLTMSDGSTALTTPPDEHSFDDVLDICGEACAAIFISE